MIKAFIDGREGTTGLQIESRLRSHPSVGLLEIDPELRKDALERKRLLNSADVAFLCLPDDAARQAVSMVNNDRTVIIDASTAHRTNPGWSYGFPELSKAHMDAVRSSNRIAVPGCHATGFCALVYPLVEQGIVARSAQLSCFSLSGYSGAGKKLIAEYGEGLGKRPELMGARPYALGLTHKHLPEMTAVCGLESAPVFQPNVAPVSQGMLVSVPLAVDARTVYEALYGYYPDEGFVRVMPFGAEDCLQNGFIDMQGCNGTNRLEIFVFGHQRQTLLMARLDNLGKGASGAAVQCMELRFSLKASASQPGNQS